MHILSPVTDNCSSWISGRGRMAAEMFSWPSLHERMCRTWGSNAGPLACQANTLPIEIPHSAPRLTCVFAGRTSFCWFCYAAAYDVFLRNKNLYMVLIWTLSPSVKLQKIFYYCSSSPYSVGKGCKCKSPWIDKLFAKSYEPHQEKTCLWCLWQGKTQTGLLSYRD